MSAIRLSSQQIATTKFTNVKEIVSHMGAIQAQDYPMAKWAIGVRLPGSTDAAIEDAFNRGDILRTHVLRPTWHFVSSDDIYQMIELTGPLIKTSLRSRHQQLGLNQRIYNLSNTALTKALSRGEQMTRDQLFTVLKRSKIINDTSRLYHLLLIARSTLMRCYLRGFQRKRNLAE